MRITYLTSDEPNGELVAHTARACGADLKIVPPLADRLSTPAEASLYDLDHPGVEDRRAILAGLLRGRPTAPVAVHGYDLGDAEIAALRARGIAASRRLGPEVVRQLCRDSMPDPRPHPDRDGRSPETDGDDPATLGTLARSLASTAHRALSPAIDGVQGSRPDELIELRAKVGELFIRIDRLRRLHGQQLEDLRRWADSLERLVETHLRADGLGTTSSEISQEPGR